MKIYTKGGDQGQTFLLGGVRIAKSSQRVELLGTIDELNSVLGVALSAGPDDATAARLERTQRQLFALGAQVAGATEVAVEKHRPSEQWTLQLESEIDRWTEELPPLKNFILPGGHPAGAAIHWARSICRRAERSYFAEPIPRGELAGIYLNRLGDWLFVLARYVNHKSGHAESIWSGRDEGV